MVLRSRPAVSEGERAGKETIARTGNALSTAFGLFDEYYQAHKAADGSAHGRKHVYSVAMNAVELIGKVYKGDAGLPVESLQHVVAICAMAHDFVRNPAEKGKAEGRLEESDGYLTANALEVIRKADLESGNNRYGLATLADAEFDAVQFAIRENENPLSKTKATLADVKISPLKRYMLLGLTWGDKGTEGLGARVIKRRAEFVSGERCSKLEGKSGDLVDYIASVEMVSEDHRKIPLADMPKRARALVFALESLRRTRAGKVETDYPEDLQKEVRRLRELEYDVFWSAASYLGFKGEADLLKFGLDTGYPGFAKEREKIEGNMRRSEFGIDQGKGEEAAALINYYTEMWRAKALGSPMPVPPGGDHVRLWMSQIAAAENVEPIAQFKGYVESEVAALGRVQR